jgi:endonuclease III
MKHGSEYAKRVKRLLGQLTRKFGKPEASEPLDPIEQLIIGILAGCTTLNKAHAVYRRLRQHVVDLNELRVTPASELAEQIGDGVPLAVQKARRIVDALNAIRKRQDSLDLSFLKQRGRREAREYLEAIDGVDRATAASVMLYSLGGHAVPLDDLLLYVLRKEDLVDPKAEPAEVQSFLEHCLHASHAQSGYELLSRYAASKPLKFTYEQLADVVNPPPPPPPPPPAAKLGKAVSGVGSAGAATTKAGSASVKAAAATGKASRAGATGVATKTAVSGKASVAPLPKNAKSRPSRLAETAKVGGNHQRAAGKSADARKKK